MGQGRRLNVLIVLMAMILTGCDSENSVKFDPDPTNSSIRDLYKENDLVIHGLVEFCQKNPAVKWLGSNDIDLSTLSDVQPDPETLSSVRKNLSSLGAISLVCTRDWSLINAPLVSVTLPLYGVGISVSGSSKGIRYFSKISDYVQRRTENGELISLGDEGWYIYLSDS